MGRLRSGGDGDAKMLVGGEIVASSVLCERSVGFMIYLETWMGNIKQWGR